MRVIAGSASARLGGALADLIGSPPVRTEIRQFPDGEVYLRLDEAVAGEDVAVVQTTYPNDRLIELFLLQEAARAGGARSVVAVVPYFAYSRQDVAFRPGEVVSARAIAELVSLKADRVITVDPHKEHVLGFFRVPAAGVTAVPALAERLRVEGVDIVLAPDKGALDRARLAAKHLGVDHDYLEKTRVSGTEVRVAPKSLDVRGKRVAIVDDIISTGGTIATAAGELRAQGASRVVAACTHGLFLNEAAARLRKAGCDAVIASDTIEGLASVVSAASAVASALR